MSEVIDDLRRELANLKARVAHLETLEYGVFVPLTSPLTSTSWDGDSYSNSNVKVLIDLSTVFGAPAGIKAILVRVLARDSASSTVFGKGIMLSPNDVNADGPMQCRTDGPDDLWVEETAVIPCNADGDVYYRTWASGVDTLDVFIQIWGYFI